MNRIVLNGVVSAALLTAGVLQAQELKGKALYEARCGGCHAIEHHRIGPRHAGLGNRLVGTEKGFEYSKALELAGVQKQVRWSRENLDRWLVDPELFLPGQVMNYALGNAGERKLIVDYLFSQ